MNLLEATFPFFMMQKDPNWRVQPSAENEHK